MMVLVGFVDGMSDIPPPIVKLDVTPPATPAKRM
jgi:hypothetical protein